MRHIFLLLLLALSLPACGLTNKPLTFKIDADYPVSDAQFARTVGNLLGPPLVAGNKVTTLQNGDEIFPAMLDAIRAAQKTITFETYVYWSGDIGHQFSQALAERAAAGVQVHVLLDWHGSLQADHKDLELMKSSGVDLKKYHVWRFFDPYTYAELDHRTHRKVLVVDGVVGFTGGAGIADLWLGHAQDPDHWRDNHYKIEGPAVAQLQGTFADNWVKTTGEILDGADYFPPLKPVGEDFAQVFKSSPDGGSGPMQVLMLLSIAHARKNIRIQSAYFALDDQTQAALIGAAKRGVKVEIIVPGKHDDAQIVRSASRVSWGALIAAGIELYEYRPTMIHSKLLIVDDLWTSIGSSNMDNRSFRINDEANVNILNRKFAATQVELFDRDKARSHLVTLEEWRHRPFWEQFTDLFSAFAKPEL